MAMVGFFFLFVIGCSQPGKDSASEVEYADLPACVGSIVTPDDATQVICNTETEFWHQHVFQNCYGAEYGVEYYAVVHALRLCLLDDLPDVVEFSTPECSTPSDWVGCDDVTSTDYGGTTIELVQGDPVEGCESGTYIEWTYGIDVPNEKPFVPGLNDYDSDGVIDNTEDDRDMGESFYQDISLPPSVEQVALTTTASVYLQVWQYDIACGEFSSDACWTEVEHEGTTEKHWFHGGQLLTTNYSASCE